MSGLCTYSYICTGFFLVFFFNAILTSHLKKVNGNEFLKIHFT